MSRIIQGFIVVLFSQASFCNAGIIKSKSLNSTLEDKTLSKIEFLEQEVQDLMNRVELLEHNLSSLEKKLNDFHHNKEIDLVHNQNFIENKDSLQGFDKDNKQNFDKDKDDLLSKIEVSESNKEREVYDQALLLLKNSKFYEAEEAFANFISSYPNSVLQSNASFWYAETFFKRNIFDKAAINYLKGYKKFPKGIKAPDSLLKLALSLNNLGKKSESCSILTKLETEFSNRSTDVLKRAKDAKIKYGCK